MKTRLVGAGGFLAVAVLGILGASVASGLARQGNPHQMFALVGNAPKAALTALQAGNDISTSAPVAAQSKDPALLSCDYRLSDRVLAQPILRSVESYSVSRGLASATDFTSGVPLEMISDNPLKKGELIVTIELSGPAVANPNILGDPVLHTKRSFIAVVDRSTGHVNGIVVASW